MAQPQQQVMTPPAMDETQQLLSEVRDIRGLENVSCWPLAPGWWILLGLLFTIILGLFLFKKWCAMRARRFETQLKAMLESLRSETNIKKKAQGFSEILRLAALRKYGRAACAGLEGKDWLDWLKAHDPKGFDWTDRAGILIEAPYMPDQVVAKSDADFDALFKAAERWVKQ